MKRVFISILLGVLLAGIGYELYINFQNNKYNVESKLQFYHEEAGSRCRGLDYELVEELSFKVSDKNYSVFLLRCSDKMGEYFGEHALIVSLDKQLMEPLIENETYINIIGLERFRNEDLNYFRDLVLELSTGGNGWVETRQEIIRFDSNGVHLITKDINSQKGVYSREAETRIGGLAIRKVVDLDSDGVRELIVMESTWEMSFGFCHACSPYTQKVFSWDGKRYVENSKKFPSVYEQQQKTAKDRWFDRDCSMASDYTTTEDCLSSAIQFLLASDALDKRDEGWKFFWKNTNPDTFGDSEAFPSLITVRETLREQYANGEEFSPSYGTD